MTLLQVVGSRFRTCEDYVLLLHEWILRCSSVTAIELCTMKSLWVNAVSDSSWINVESTRNSEHVCVLIFHHCIRKKMKNDWEADLPICHEPMRHIAASLRP
jgi:hypothetical protein